MTCFERMKLSRSIIFVVVSSVILSMPLASVRALTDCPGTCRSSCNADEQDIGKLAPCFLKKGETCCQKLGEEGTTCTCRPTNQCKAGEKDIGPQGLCKASINETTCCPAPFDKSLNPPTATPSGTATKQFEGVNLINPIGGSESKPKGETDIPKIIGRVISIFTGVVGSLALLMFVYGSFVLMTSGGAPDRVERGKKTMVQAIIGLAVIFTAYAVIQLLFTTLGAS